MNSLKFLSILITTLFIISCNKESDEDQENITSRSQFVLKDSILVDYLGNIQLTDYHSATESYLGLDISSNAIIQFNREGEILYNPIKSGEGPEFVTGRIFSLGFSENRSILAQTRSALYELNFQGDILKKIKFPKESLYSNIRYTNSVIGNKVLLLHDNNTDLRPDKRQYFDEVRHITVVDLETGEVTFKIPFQEGSMYKNEDFYYRTTTPAFSLNMVDSTINIIYPHEKKLYQYALDKDFSLKNIFNTNPENFKEPEKASYGEELNIMRSLAYDSYYLNIFNNKEYIILEYMTGLPETVSPPKAVVDLNNLMIENNNRYYEIFKNGKKIGSDIEQPKGMMDLRYFHENNQVVFQLDKREAEKDYEVFYLYGIDF